MLSRLIAFLGVVWLCALTAACTSPPPDNASASDTVPLHGAGATFPAPLYKKWIEAYQKDHPKVLIHYDVVGSGEGTEKFLAGAVDFGASDAALSDEEIASVTRGVQLVPVTAGSLVLAYNLPDLGGDLKLKRDVYVDIFLGEITRWDDPRIAATNPDLKLPKNDITVVARSDSSGTTFAFTNHLSAISATWRDRGPGAVRVADWPGNTMLAPGNEGVAGRIQQSTGAIGYVQYGIARHAGLKMAWLENKAGRFIQPHGGSGLATLIQAQMPENLRIFLPDPDGRDSYPIVTYSWLLLYKQYDDAQKRDALKRYVQWCLTEGQTLNETLGYLRLAPHVVAQAMEAVEQL
jgi:phosphate transport system substrate-binding protein